MIQTMDEPGELLDLVDSQDSVIDTISRHEILSLEENGRGFARAVGVFIINSRGELWIPRRSTHKKVAPGGLDFSAGEHVGSGESYQAAALRGLDEELNLTPDVNKLHELGSVPPFLGIPYFHTIFKYSSDEVPNFNHDDYTAYEWLRPEETAQRLRNGEPAKEILLPSVELLIEHLKNEGESR